MAVIEYIINVDRPNGNAIVTHVIAEYGPAIDDQIRFSSNQPDTAIMFVGDSPFNPKDETAPRANTTFRVGTSRTKAFKVDKVLTSEQSIRFNCGHVKEADPEAFIPWGGGG